MVALGITEGHGLGACCTRTTASIAKMSSSVPMDGIDDRSIGGDASGVGCGDDLVGPKLTSSMSA